MSAGQCFFKVLELDGACAVVEVRRNNDLLAPDEHLVHEILEELLARLGCVNSCFSEALVERADGGLVLVERRRDVLSLDGSVKLTLLLL